jgi:hypothetical protein
VHFFNRWPLQATAKTDYISCFPASTWKLRNGTQSPHYTLVDATPDYMFNSMAAPRIKAMWPNAKFIVLLRVRPLALPAVTFFGGKFTFAGFDIMNVLIIFPLLRPALQEFFMTIKWQIAPP